MTYLRKQLTNEYQNAQLMTNLCSQMEDKLQRTSHKQHKHRARKQPRKRKRDITPPAQPAPTTQPTTPAQIPATKNINTGTINFTCIQKAYLFEPKKTKLTPIRGRDWEDELWLCKNFKRPMRKFLVR